MFGLFFNQKNVSGNVLSETSFTENASLRSGAIILCDYNNKAENIYSEDYSEFSSFGSSSFSYNETHKSDDNWIICNPEISSFQLKFGSIYSLIDLPPPSLS